MSSERKLTLATAVSFAAMALATAALLAVVLERIGMSESVGGAIGAMAGAILGGSALGVSIWQGMLQRRNARLMLKPCLDFRWTMDGEKAWLALVNSGPGPALLTDLVLEISEGIAKRATPAEWKRVADSLRLKPIYKSLDVQGRMIIGTNVKEMVLTCGVYLGKKEPCVLRVTAVYESLNHEKLEEAITLYQDSSGAISTHKSDDAVSPQ